MTGAQFKALQKWFQNLNQKIGKIERSMSTKGDMTKLSGEIDQLHGLIERVHRRIDDHLAEDDKEKRLFKLAIERLDEKIEALQEQL